MKQEARGEIMGEGKGCIKNTSSITMNLTTLKKTMNLTPLREQIAKSWARGNQKSGFL